MNKQTLNRAISFTVILLIGSLINHSNADDLQLWMPVQLIHPMGVAWDISMETEIRLEENISDFSQLVYKPVNWPSDLRREHLFISSLALTSRLTRNSMNKST